MKRFLSVWFQDWPLTRLRRSRRGLSKGTARRASEQAEVRRPFVLVEAGPHGLRVVAANESAQRSGVQAGLRFTDARARVPGIESEEIDREADHKALWALGDWLVRISPIIALDGDDGLMVETTGCAHLHGGEGAMMTFVAQLFEREGIACQMGLAGTPGAASAVARAAPGLILAEGKEAEGLAGLPVAALRVSEKAETLLRRFGLTRIGQLYGIERKALARRFQSKAEADAVVLRLDQALGLRREPLVPLRPVPVYTRGLPCPEPLLSGDGIRAGLVQLADELCYALKEAGQGGRGFVLSAYRSDGLVKRAGIHLAQPSATPGHICRLFTEQVDKIDPGFGIDLITLEAHRVSPLNVSTSALSGELSVKDYDSVALSALSDRISVRLGDGAVRIVRQVESHIPENSENWMPFEGGLDGVQQQADAGPRPVRLLAHPELLRVLAEVPDGPPQRFVWRKVARTVMRADGPERIAPEWWKHVAPPPVAPSPEGAARGWLTPRLDRRADSQIIDKVRREMEADLDLDTRPLAVRASAFTAGLEEAGLSPKLLQAVEKACDEIAIREKEERVWLMAPVRDAELLAEVRKNLPRARDYYRIEDSEGRRYWVFREGLYEDGRGGPPEWFIHGIFA